MISKKTNRHANWDRVSKANWRRESKNLTKNERRKLKLCDEYYEYEMCIFMPSQHSKTTLI